jgi:hypothetical protein
MALALIFAAAPFQHDLSIGGPVKFSLAEINLLLICPVLLLSGQRLRIGAIGIPVALYLAICVLASLLSWRDTSLVSLVQTTLYLVVTVVIFASLPRLAEDLRPALIGLVIVGVFLASVAVAFRSSYVLGLHKNGLGASLAAALIVGVELWFSSTSEQQKWYTAALVVIALGLVMSLSRGAWMGALLGVFILMVLRREFALMTRLALLVLPVIAALWLSLPGESREYATDLRLDSYNINARVESLDYALNAYRQGGVLGVGVGFRKEYDATNVIMSTLAETGLAGVAAFLLIHWSFFRRVSRDRVLLDRQHLSFSLVAIGTALFAAKLGHGMVDHYWGRGSATMAMGGVGMATFGLYSARQRLLLARLLRQRQSDTEQGAFSKLPSNPRLEASL